MLRENIEFVIAEMQDIAEKQITILKTYTEYLGLTFDDILFDLKRFIYLNNLDAMYESNDEFSG